MNSFPLSATKECGIRGRAVGHDRRCFDRPGWLVRLSVRQTCGCLPSRELSGANGEGNREEADYVLSESLPADQARCRDNPLVVVSAALKRRTV